jgi:hypothetical protein
LNNNKLTGKFSKGRREIYFVTIGAFHTQKYTILLYIEIYAFLNEISFDFCQKTT